MDIANLGYKIDSSQLAKAVIALDKNTAAAARADKATDKLEASWKRMGKTIGLGIAAIGGVAVAGFAKYIRNTIEAEKVQAQLASRIKDTGGVAQRSVEQLNATADAMQRLTTFDDEKIGEVQAMLLTFKNIRGDIFDAATASVLDLATAMGTDANSAALQLGKALNDPIKGIAALGRAGVQFSTDQKKVIEGLITTGKVAEAQRLILKEVEGQMGTAAEAARNTLGGALEGLKNTFDNLLEGDSGGTGMTGMVTAVNDLNTSLSDPGLKRGIDGLASGILAAANAAVKGAAMLGSFISSYREFLSSKGFAIANETTSIEDLQTRLTKLQNQSGKAMTRWLAGDEIAAEIKKTQDLISAFPFRGVTTSVDTTAKPPQATQPFNVSMPETADKTDKAEAAAKRMAKALRDMSEAQREWQTELSGTGNPILDDYAERLDKIQSQVEDFASSGVPTEKIAAFTAEMSKLADQIKDKAVVDYLAEFDLATRTLAASMAGDGSSSLIAYESAVRDLNKEMQAGILTQELYDERLQALADQRDSAAENVLRDLNMETDALGKSAEWIAKRNALINAGVDAESEYGMVILDTVSGLYEQSRAMEDQVSTMDGLRGAAKGFFEDIRSGVGIWDALSNAVTRFTDRITSLVEDRIIEQLFGQMGTSGQGTSGGGWISSLAGALFGGGGGSADSAGSVADLISSFGSGGTYGGGRAFGGGVRDGMHYRTGEGNHPELLDMGRGRQYLIPGDSGRVEPMSGSADVSIGPTTNNIYVQGRITNDTTRQLSIRQSQRQRLSVARFGA